MESAPLLGSRARSNSPSSEEKGQGGRGQGGIKLLSLHTPPRNKQQLCCADPRWQNKSFSSLAAAFWENMERRRVKISIFTSAWHKTEAWYDNPGNKGSKKQHQGLERHICRWNAGKSQQFLLYNLPLQNSKPCLSSQLQTLHLTCVIPPLTVLHSLLLLLRHPTLLLPYRHSTVIFLSTQRSVLFHCSTVAPQPLETGKFTWKQAQKHLFCILPWILLLCLKSEWVLLEADLQDFLFCHLLCECWDKAEQKLNTFPPLQVLQKASLKRT